MKLHAADTWKDNIWRNFLGKICFRSAAEVKKGQISQNDMFSRNSLVAQKLEQLEENRKKTFESSLDATDVSSSIFSLINIQSSRGHQGLK